MYVGRKYANAGQGNYCGDYAKMSLVFVVYVMLCMLLVQHVRDGCLLRNSTYSGLGVSRFCCVIIREGE